MTNHVRSIFWSLYGIAVICFGSRVVARTRRFGGTFWWDDWFIVASFCVLSAVTIGAELSKSSRGPARTQDKDRWMADLL